MRITVASSGGIAENKRRRVHVLRGASVCSHTEYWSQLLVHRYSYFASFVRSQHCRLLRSLLAAAAAAPSFRLSPLRTRETREAVRVGTAKIRERDSPCYFSRRFQRHADGVCISLFGEKKRSSSLDHGYGDRFSVITFVFRWNSWKISLVAY